MKIFDFLTKSSIPAMKKNIHKSISCFKKIESGILRN